VVDLQASQVFLHALWDGKPDEHYILLWTLADKRSAWFQKIDAAAAYVAAQGAADIYTGVGLAPQDYGPDQRCKSEDIAGISGLWADLDIHSPAHDKPLPKTRAEALALVPSWIPPTYTISTGNGLQVWLLFREPWMFDSPAERIAAANLELRFQTVIANRSQEQGYTYERLADLARVARLPGTFNCKDPQAPKSVETISNSGPRWNPSELIDLFDELNIADPALESIRAAGSCRFTIEPNPIVPAGLIEGLREVDRTFKATWDQKRRNLKDSSPSGYDLALANIGVLAGLTDQAIVNLLITWRARHGHPSKLRPDYYLRTLHKVRSTLAMPEPEPIARAAAAAAPTLALVPSPKPEAPPSGSAPPPSSPPPPPKTDSKRHAAAEAVAQALRLHVKRVRKVRGENPSYIVDLIDGRSAEMSGSDFFNQNRFAGVLFVAFDFAIPRFKEAQWRGILGSLSQLIEPVTRDLELTAEGVVVKFLLSYLAEVPFQLEPLSRSMSIQKFYPLVREEHVAVSATHLSIYVKQTFHEAYSVATLALMLQKIGSRPWRERLGRQTEQSRWLLPSDQFPAEEYVHIPEKGKGEMR
jgi:hypothetical protein